MRIWEASAKRILHDFGTEDNKAFESHVFKKAHCAFKSCTEYIAFS